MCIDVHPSQLLIKLDEGNANRVVFGVGTTLNKKADSLDFILHTNTSITIAHCI